MSESPTTEATNFIEKIVEQDLAAGMPQIVTRFPPEPNGYLHLGHATAVCLQFGIAGKYGGRCHLRFDDTNPETEKMEYVEAAQRDIRWLGFDWGDHLYFASDYFEQLYDFAVQLVKNGKAYVDSLSEQEIRAYRGTVTEAGRPSPYRDRPAEESLDLLARMRAGEFPDGAHVLRARIDMASPNMLMRDPVLYRIKHAEHYRRGSDWPIYPLYDFAHPLSDAIESITHSLCTLEFDVHRPLYDWLVDAVTVPPRPHQYEYARRNLEYTVVSKRKLLKLVGEGHVDGWDDPRMPTIAAARRRGITPGAIRRFSELVGIAKSETRIDIGLLEHAIRDDLNHRAPRVLVVLDPLKVTISNWPEGEIEWLDADFWPHDVPREGSRKLPLGRTIYVDRSDFAENPSKKWFRLAPGAEVRLRHGYIIRCNDVVRDADGQVAELICSYDPDTRSGADSRNVKGTVHWVEASHAVPVEVREYDRLFTVPHPDDPSNPEIESGAKTFLDYLNPSSKRVITRALAEPGLKDAAIEDRFQFERQGYYFVDPIDSKPGAPVFNRTITLRDTWGRKSGPTTPEPVRRKPRPAQAAPSGPAIPDLDEAQQGIADDLARRFGLSSDDAAILAYDADLTRFFETATAAGSASPVAVANWVLHELQRERRGRAISDLALDAGGFATLVRLAEEGAISGSVAKELLAELVEDGGDPEAMVKERGLQRIDDDAALRLAAEHAVQAHPDKAAAYRGGKTGLLGFFMGQVMRATGGRANAARVKELLGEVLSAE